MVDVFISYSRTDLAAVTRLAQMVEAEGYEVWWDADLPPHLSYGDVITAKIGMAKAAIVVWSKESAASEWVRAEADMARNQKKLVQTALDNVMPPLPFNQIQYADLGDWRGEPDHPAWLKVKESLNALVGPPKRAKSAKRAASTRPSAAPASVPPTSQATAAPGSARPMSQATAAAAASVPPTPQATAAPPPPFPRSMIYGVAGATVVTLLLVLASQLVGDTPIPADQGQAATFAGPVVPTAPAPAATAVASASDTQNRQVVIANASSQTLQEFYASPVTSDSWEEDMLGSNVLAAGESISANIDNGTGECSFDLKAVMADGQEHIQRAVNVCAVSTWTVSDAGTSTS